MSRRRGIALAAAALALLVIVLGWLMADSGGSAVPQRGEVAVTAPLSAQVEMPQLAEAPRAIELPAPPEPAAPAPVALPVPRAHRAHDGLVSLDDDGRGLSGRVLDSNGRGLAGAQLLLVRERWGIDSGLSVDEEDRALADARGRYRLQIENEVGIEELRLYVTAAGFPPWIGRIEPVGDGPDIVLGPLQTLVLQLVFSDGGPIAGATVRWEDPTWEQDHENQRDIVALTTVGQTDASGRLTLSVPVARPDVSLVVKHDLHVGRHLVPLEAWRAAGATAPIVISVPGPRGAALELLVDDWDETALERTPFVALTLDAFERGPDGTLVPAQPSLTSPSAGSRGDYVKAGRALVADVEAPAYRVTLWAWGNMQVLNECWTPVPGLTTWHARLPQPDGTWKAPLRVDLVASDGTALGEAWGVRSRQLEATQGEQLETKGVTDPSQPVVFFMRGEGPVTLRLAELGDAGVRTDVPSHGTYRFVVQPELLQSGHGNLRVDLSFIVPAPPPDDVWLQVRPDGQPVERVDGRLEVQGLPAGPCRVWVHARGVDEDSQLVSIEPGETSVLLARVAPEPPWGRIRGRVVIRGDDSWMRLTDVRLRNTATGAPQDAGWQQGLQSFCTLAEPGHYEGEVTVGRLASPAACAAAFADVTILPPHRWNSPRLTGRFEVDVRRGEISDVVVEVNATPLCDVTVTAPQASEPPQGSPADDWRVEASDASGAEVASARVGTWPPEGVQLRLAPGHYRLSATHGQAASPAPAWEVPLEVPEGTRCLDVELGPPADAR